MPRNRTLAAILLTGAVFLAGCQENNLAASLRQSGAVSTPDEFLVLPTRPLEIPQDLATLPVPQLGAANRVDYRPKEEAVAGLTGRPGPAGTTSGAALVASVPPSDPQIRPRLAAEDVTYRSENRGLFFERVFATDQDALIYREEVLDAPEEFQRVRSAGVRVPAPPPSVMDLRPIPPSEPDPLIRAYRPVPPSSSR